MIVVKNISKSLNNFKILKNISFEVNDGEILGLLGQNGAGKTTLLRVLSTMLRPDAGSAEINGFDLRAEPEKIRSITGILFGSEAGLYERLTVKENLEYFAELNLMNKEQVEKRIKFLSEKFEFKSYLNKFAFELSKGMKQKVSIARAIIHNPCVMLLDEPESGLDFKASRIVLDFIDDCKKEGKCVIFSSHSLENIKNYSDRTAVIDKGKIINIFSVSKYREKYTEREINDMILSWVCKEEKKND